MLNLEQLNTFANFLQVLNYMENITQTSNDVILAKLERQDDKYLKMILNNQVEILKRLERLEKNV